MEEKHLYLKQAEFMDKINKYVQSDDMKKAFEATYFSKSPNAEECYQAMMHGMVWAALLTSQCNLYVLTS